MPALKYWLLILAVFSLLIAKHWLRWMHMEIQYVTQDNLHTRKLIKAKENNHAYSLGGSLTIT